MKVLIFPSWYPTKESPIYGIFFKEQAKSLIHAGVDAAVLFPEAKSIKGFKMFNKENGVFFQVEDNIPTIRYIDYNYAPGSIASAVRMQFYNRIKVLYSRYKKQNGKPDLIHAHSAIWGGWAAMRIAEEEGIPFIITEHSSLLGRNLYNDYQIKMMKETYEKADKLIAVSPSLKDEMLKLVPNKEISVIANIVNLDNFSLKVPKKQTGKFRFFSLALLNKNKGMDILIKAFASKFAEKLDIELVIGGNGVERENLEALTKELKIESQVHFLGEIDREQVVKEMQQADIFVLASLYETFGVVFIEALACGTPVIGTKCGGPELIIHENNGYIVEKNNPEHLGQAMEKAVNEYEKFKGIALRSDCLNRFGEDKIIKEIMNIYKVSLNAHEA